MSKNASINEFLLFLKDLAIENPTFPFGEKEGMDRIYHELVHIGVKDEDRKVNLSKQVSMLTPNFSMNSEYASPLAAPHSTFNNWIQNYAQSRNTRVFIEDDKEWSYFCQFTSRNKRARATHEHLKVYIPLDAKHIEFGVKQIFDFLDANDISHISKVGSEIRFDNVVIRLANPDDVDKLINFVKTSRYIQEGLIEPNPFAFSRDNIALACDGSQSYNGTVANLINLYIAHHKKEKTLNKISVEDFYEYVNELYTQQFLTHTSDLLEKTLDWISPKEERNFREILRLIIKAHNKDFKYQDFLGHYAESSGRIILNDRTVLNTKRLLIECLKALNEKYGSDVALNNMRSFYYTGNEDCITRDFNLRDRIVESGFRKDLHAFLEQSHLTYDQFVDNILSQYHVDLEKGRQK